MRQNSGKHWPAQFVKRPVRVATTVQGEPWILAEALTLSVLVEVAHGAGTRSAWVSARPARAWSG